MCDAGNFGIISSPDRYCDSFQEGAKSLMDLPLNLIALIIAYVSGLSFYSKRTQLTLCIA